MASYSILKSIATGSPNTEAETLNGREQLAYSELSKATEVLNSIPTSLKPSERYKLYKDKTRNMIPHPDTVDQFWDLEESIYPGKDFKANEIERIKSEVATFTTYQDIDNYYTNHLHTWPSWLKSRFSQDAADNRQRANARNVELARINKKLDVENVMNNVIKQDNFKLSAEVSKRVHIEDAVLALKYGYNDIQTKEGRIAVSNGKEYVPVFSLDPDMQKSMDERRSSMHLQDSYKIVEEILEAPYSKAAMSHSKADNVLRKKLYEKLDKLGARYSEHHGNILLDYAITQDNPKEVLQEGMGKIMNKAIEEGNYDSIESLYTDMAYIGRNLLQTAERRLGR